MSTSPPRIDTPVTPAFDCTRRPASASVQRATQLRRGAWHRGSFTVRAMLMLLMAASQAAAEMRSPLEEASALQQQLRAVVERSAPSVYAVTAFTDAPTDSSLYGAGVRGAFLAAIADTRGRSCGSAFAIDSSGHLLTNEHVISGARSVWVTNDAGQVLPALVVGSDPRTDLAILFVPAATQPLPMAQDAPQRGDLVAAMGNPDGLATEGKLAASVGCVSATGRSLGTLSANERRAYADLIQVTTPVGIGGSGGPLIDLAGNVVGIISAVSAADRDDLPVGFAIALSPATRERVARLTRGEEIIHPYFGVTVSSAPTSAKVAGVRIERVEANAPADGPLREGDVVLSVDGQPVAADAAFIEAAAACSVDQDVRLSVQRDDQVIEILIRPTRRPLPAAPVTIATQRFHWAGVTFANAAGGGAIILENADAERAPLPPGGIVRGINGGSISGLADMVRVLHRSAGAALELDLR
jgi:S1-C subfamily serine protease